MLWPLPSDRAGLYKVRDRQKAIGKPLCWTLELSVVVMDMVAYRGWASSGNWVCVAKPRWKICDSPHLFQQGDRALYLSQVVDSDISTPSSPCWLTTKFWSWVSLLVFLRLNIPTFLILLFVHSKEELVTWGHSLTFLGLGISPLIHSTKCPEQHIRTSGKMNVQNGLRGSPRHLSLDTSPSLWNIKKINIDPNNSHLIPSTHVPSSVIFSILQMATLTQRGWITFPLSQSQVETAGHQRPCPVLEKWY